MIAMRGGGPLAEKVEGTLIIIGGLRIKRGKEILKAVCSKINKEEDELLIATVATESPAEVGAQYRSVLA